MTKLKRGPIQSADDIKLWLDGRTQFRVVIDLDKEMDIAVGDTVWFPEAWRYFLGEDARIEYRAGGVRELIDREFHLLPNMNINDAEIASFGGDVKRWRSPATMPAWAARIRVEIVSVRLEQVGPQRVFVYDTKEAANG